MKFKIKFRKNDVGIQSIFLILTSFLGLILLMAMYIWIPSVKSYYYLQKPLILSIFILICILGIISALYPSKCKMLMKSGGKLNEIDELENELQFLDEKEETNLKNLKRNQIRFKGHHPDCGKFKSHTLLIKGKKYCPGCTGLSVGAFLAILGISIYYFLNFPAIFLHISFWIGCGMVFLMLLLIIFLDLGNRLKLIANMTLVLGSLFLLVGIDAVKKNIIIEFYFLILVVFWILTRMSISEINHKIICQKCREESFCIYDKY
jgi:hypothetical protein